MQASFSMHAQILQSSGLRSDTFYARILSSKDYLAFLAIWSNHTQQEYLWWYFTVFALLTCFTNKWIINLLWVNLMSIIAIKILIYRVFHPWKLTFSQNCDFHHSAIVLPLLLFLSFRSWMIGCLVSMVLDVVFGFFF